MSSEFPPVPGREPMLDIRTNKISRVWFMFFDNFSAAINAIIPALRATEQAVAGTISSVAAIEENINDVNLALSDMSTAIGNLTSTKQDNLVSGINIKTVMGADLLGSGNLEINIPPVVTIQVSSYVETNTKGRIISICDASSGNITISLPDCATCAGVFFTAKKIDITANTITLDPNGSQSIDGASIETISIQYGSVTIFSNGSTWYKV